MPLPKKDFDRKAERYRHTVPSDKVRSCPNCTKRIVWHYSEKKGTHYPCDVLDQDEGNATYSRCYFHEGCRIKYEDKEPEMMNDSNFQLIAARAESTIAGSEGFDEKDEDIVNEAARAMCADDLKKLLSSCGVAPSERDLGDLTAGRWRADARKEQKLRCLAFALQYNTTRPCCSLERADGDVAADSGPTQLIDEPPTTAQAALDTLKAALGAQEVDLEQVARIAAEEAGRVVTDALKNYDPPDVARRVVIEMPGIPEIDCGIQHETFPEFVSWLSAGLHIWAHGPAASGKTFAAEAAAKALGLDFFPFSVGPGTMASEIVGHVLGEHYHRTVFREAYEHGGMFCIDEADTGSPNCLTKINAALANGYMSFPDGVIQQHANFSCCALANTGGTGQSHEYSRNKQDGATLDRFVFQYWAYDAALERALCPIRAWANLVQSARAACKALEIRQIVSMRAACNGATIILAGSTPERAAEACIWKTLDKSSIERIITWIDTSEDATWDQHLLRVKHEVQSIKTEAETAKE